MGFRLLINESGISMATSLLTIVIMMMTLPLISFIFKQLNAPQLSEDIKFEQFFHFVHDDMLRANDIFISDNKIFLEKSNGDLASLAQYNNLIRRQVRGVGHEEYIKGVRSFQVNEFDHYIHIKMTSLKGDVYEKTIPIY